MKGSEHHDAVEGRTGFRVVPSNELVDGIFIQPARAGRCEAIERGHLGMFEVGQSKYDPAIVCFDFSVSHAWRSPDPQHGIKAQDQTLRF
jgi:hypothetical protein